MDDPQARDPQRLDPQALAAFDVHVHAEVSGAVRDSLSPEARAAPNAYFGVDRALPTLPEIAAYYRERAMACVVFPVDSRGGHRGAPGPQRGGAEAAAANPEVLVPFVSIVPARGRAAGVPAVAGARGTRVQAAPQREGVLAERPVRLPAVRGVPGARRPGGDPYRAHRHRYAQAATQAPYTAGQSGRQTEPARWWSAGPGQTRTGLRTSGQQRHGLRLPASCCASGGVRARRRVHRAARRAPSRCCGVGGSRSPRPAGCARQ